MQLQELQVRPHSALQLVLHDARALDQQLAHLLIAEANLIFEEVQLVPDGRHSQLKQTVTAARCHQLGEISLRHAQLMKQGCLQEEPCLSTA